MGRQGSCSFMVLMCLKLYACSGIKDPIALRRIGIEFLDAPPAQSSDRVKDIVAKFSAPVKLPQALQAHSWVRHALHLVCLSPASRISPPMHCMTLLSIV